MSRRTLVIGVGNGWRGDDAAGLLVARRLRDGVGADVAVREHEGDGSTLLDGWPDIEHVILIDAASSGAPAGTVHRFEAGTERLPATMLRSSTHAFGVADTVELARALDRLPCRLEVYAIEGADFSIGAALSPAVARAVGDLVAALAERLEPVARRSQASG